ncbi:hypothetical protein M9Y10_001408 [Tritrichomonas musculus]|uniref:Uncharacterized protein n=1 Tax=Tritrichomonas musculus TaxID=1915356 RepID=A0ABR2L6Y6_9EUKA
MKSFALRTKIIALIGCIFELMIIQYDDLADCSFIVDFPYQFIIDEQKKLIQKSGIDKSNMNMKNTIDKLPNFVDYNKSKLDEFKKKGFVISKNIKWTIKNKFEAISEEEYNKEARNIEKYSNVEFNLDISDQFKATNASFENLRAIGDFIIKPKE